MSKVAYELRAEYEDSGFGGVIAYGPDRHSFDVAENLEAGDGKIVTDDPQLIAALDSYPALKHTTAGETPPVALPGVAEEEQPEGAVTPDEATERKELADAYNEDTAEELKKEADKRGLDIKSGAKKDEIVNALVDDDLKEE